MDKLIVLDSNFEPEHVVDVYESLIWTSRYKDAGDFELYTPINEVLLSHLAVGKYLFERRYYNPETDEAYIMIIESIELNEQHLKVTGSDLKSILARRIIWGQKILSQSSDVLTGLTSILNENLISPSISDRIISNFVFETSSGDWGTVDEDIQYEGNSLLEVANDLSEKFHFGYEVLLNFTDKKFHMKLIQPVDHSYEQTDNPPVVFSAKFTNLKSSNYLESSANYKNVAYVSGERYSDDEIDKYHQTAVIGSARGLDRRELFVDASSIRHELDDGTIYGTTTYENMIKQKGESELNKDENAYQKKYEGEGDDAASNYVFMQDYTIGDTVEIITEYGMSNSVRVGEMVLNVSTSGITFIPTFEAIEEEEQ